LVNFIFNYIKDYETSKDIVQVTFSKIWRQKEKIEINSSVKSYLYQIAKNTMIDHIRKEAKSTNNIELNDEVAGEIPDFSTDEINPYLIRSAIERCLIQQKARPREIFILNKFEGLTYQEVADHLGISKRAVEDNIYKIMVFLKEELKNHPDIFN